MIKKYTLNPRSRNGEMWTAAEKAKQWIRNSNAMVMPGNEPEQLSDWKRGKVIHKMKYNKRFIQRSGGEAEPRRAASNHTRSRPHWLCPRSVNYAGNKRQGTGVRSIFRDIVYKCCNLADIYNADVIYLKCVTYIFLYCEIFIFIMIMQYTRRNITNRGQWIPNLFLLRSKLEVIANLINFLCFKV